MAMIATVTDCHLCAGMAGKARECAHARRCESCNDHEGTNEKA
jgi:hypothetical protein